MQQADFWTQSAHAMEMTVEGNRLIGNDIVERARDLWHRLGNAVIAMLSAEHRNLPPV